MIQIDMAIDINKCICAKNILLRKKIRNYQIKCVNYSINNSISQNVSIITSFPNYVYYKINIPAFKQISELLLTITSSNDSETIIYYIIQKNYEDLQLHTDKEYVVKERNFIESHILASEISKNINMDIKDISIGKGNIQNFI